MLEEWDNQEITTKDELMDYAHELWKTAHQFEKELQNSMKGHEMQMKKLKFSSTTRIEWIKHKTSNYITVLEEALRMTKEKYQREIENMNMRLAEFESKLLNQQVEEPELTNILTLDPNSINDMDELKKLVHKLQNAGTALKSQNKHYIQTISGHEHKISTLEESVESWTQKFNNMLQIKDIYEGTVSQMLRPPMNITDTITFGKYRNIAEQNNAKELMDFLESSELKGKITNLGEDFIGLVDSMNELKKVFDNLKVIPDQPIKVDPTCINVKRVDLNDRDMNILHEAFVGGTHAHLLHQVPKEAPVVEASKRGRKGRPGKGRDAKKSKGKQEDNMFTRNEIEEKKQEIKEISEDIHENMKYLVENKYSLQLKKQRKRKGFLLEQDQQEELRKQLKISKFPLIG